MLSSESGFQRQKRESGVTVRIPDRRLELMDDPVHVLGRGHQGHGRRERQAAAR